MGAPFLCTNCGDVVNISDLLFDPTTSSPGIEAFCSRCIRQDATIAARATHTLKQLINAQKKMGA